MTRSRWARAWCLLAAFLVLVLGTGAAQAAPSPSPSPSKKPTLHDVWPYPFVTDTGVDCGKADAGVWATCKTFSKEGVLGMDGKIHCDKYGYGYGDGFGTKRAMCEATKLTGQVIAAVVPGGDPITGIPLPGPAAVEAAVGWLTKKGLEQLIDAAAASAASLFTEIARWIFSVSAPDLYRTNYADVYKSVSGVMIGLVFIVFLFAIIANVVSPRAEGWGATFGGLLRAVVGICSAAGITGLMVKLADECTTAFLGHYGNGQWAGNGWPDALKSVAAAPAVAVVGLLIAVLAIIGLLALAVIMFLRGVMLYAAGLIGAIAMLGQAHPQTRSWARQWFFTVMALAWSKFLIAALWVLGGQMLLNKQYAGGEARFADLVPALSGLALIWIMVYSPFALTRMFGFLDVQASGIDGAGVGAALLGKAKDAITDRIGGEGAGLSPEQLMNSSLDDDERQSRRGGGEPGPAPGPEGGAGPDAPVPMPDEDRDDEAADAGEAREAAAMAAAGVPADAGAAAGGSRGTGGAGGPGGGPGGGHPAEDAMSADLGTGVREGMAPAGGADGWSGRTTWPASPDGHGDAPGTAGAEIDGGHTTDAPVRVPDVGGRDEVR